MLKTKENTQFRRDLKCVHKRGKNIVKLKTIVAMLTKQERLPTKHRDHNLTGNWVNHRECHIEPDWLLIYVMDEVANTLTLVRTGTHADLFDE